MTRIVLAYRYSILLGFFVAISVFMSTMQNSEAQSENKRALRRIPYELIYRDFISCKETDCKFD